MADKRWTKFAVILAGSFLVMMVLELLALGFHPGE